MSVRIRERVPARALRLSEESAEYEPCAELTARRFMGVLLHPVPMSEMLHQCNVTQRGIKIVTNWPDCATGDHPVRVGDLVEVEGRRYVVRGVKERPACYLDIYVQEM